MNIETKDLGGAVKKAIAMVEKHKYLLLVLVIGIVLLVIPGSKNEAPVQSQASKDSDFSLEDFQSRLEDALSKVEGAGKVSVTLTLKSGTEKILAIDGQESQTASNESGMTRTESENKYEHVVISTGSGGQEVVVLKSIYPAFQGALIVCEGADSASVRLKISEAVSALTGIGADKISVVKMKK